MVRNIFLLAFGGILSLFLLPTPGWAISSAPALPSSAPLTVQEPACEPSERMPLEGRTSPYDSVAVQVGEAHVKVCYGRPAARGRTMIGGEAVPFGELWRTGANEPTTLHTTGSIRVAGVPLEPGSYSLYTRPGEEEWEVFLNRSVDRWGIPITDEVREEEVGSASVSRERPGEHVETLTLHMADAPDGGANLMLEWEDFRVTLPIRPG